MLMASPVPSPASSSRPQLYRDSFSVDDFTRSQTSLAVMEDLEEDDLSEAELRELYDNEEIDRFLDLFSAYVTEVQIPDTPPTHPNRTSVDLSTHKPPEDGEWTPIGTVMEGDAGYFPTTDSSLPAVTAYSGISEEIASKWVAPSLPVARPSPPAFTIGRLRLAIQRLHLASLPSYGPFFSHLYSLATWEDFSASFLHCTIYWTLWWYNLLFPALVLRVLFSLVQRRMSPYPSVEDLRRHRKQIEEADEFGAQVSARLMATSGDMTEIWRIIKLFDSSKRQKAKRSKDKHKEKNFAASTDSLLDDSKGSHNETAIMDDQNDSQEVKDVKTTLLNVIDGVADFHERVGNIFLWRKPKASRAYGIALSIVFLISLLPARYISKLVFFISGVVYWHITPIIYSLSESDKKRIPPPFSEVPTDAEYAMEVISQRVAAGLPVIVKPKYAKQKRKSHSTDSLLRVDVSSNTKTPVSPTAPNSIDWKKWGQRMAIGKSAVHKLKTGKGWPIQELWPPRHPIIPSAAVGIAHWEEAVETHTYPCQHSSAPGLITLTPKALFFTPLMSQNAKLMIPLSAVKGVKKAGLLKGLHIRWTDVSEGAKDQKEDRFAWVGSRDDLFARLVGADGRRWMKV